MIGRAGHRRDRQLAAEPLEQLALEPGVRAELSRELAVVVGDGVQRHVAVGHVVTEDRGEQHDVVEDVG